MQSTRLLSTGMLGIAALLFVMGGEAFAHDGDPALMHSCVNNSDGTLRLVAPIATCKKNETPVDWPASAGPATNPLRVVDSLNQFVGFPPVGGSQVARKVNDVWFLLATSPSGFNHASIPTMTLFEQSNCQGTPYLLAAVGFVRVVSTLGTDLVYPGGTPQTRSILSNSNTLTPPGGLSCFNFPVATPQLTQDVVIFDDSSLSGLIPPFRYED